MSKEQFSSDDRKVERKLPEWWKKHLQQIHQFGEAYRKQRSDKPPLTAEELRQEAEKVIGEDVVKRMGG